MKAVPDNMTVQALLELRKEGMLTSNPEYQRGEVWTKSQKKRLIDSVVRGYPIPLIYLHRIQKNVAKFKRDDFEVIDGQQRINALFEFTEGAFKLFDPKKDAEEARFPSFIEDQPCSWGGRKYDELDPSDRDKFNAVPLSVVLVETELPNEARDLFIRLQAGMPLNAQEKRDAWPGKFTEWVLKMGGKPLVPKYPGHDFFADIMKATAAKRGDTRKLAAQMMMLLMARHESKGEKLTEISLDAVDTFYYKHLDFDAQSYEAKRYDVILRMLHQLLIDGKRPKVIGYEAIHLMLLLDSLLDDYTHSWSDRLAGAFDKFRHAVKEAKKTRHAVVPSEYWLRFGQLTQTGSDRADTIFRRQVFFNEKMYELLNPQLKDRTRLFGELEGHLIYSRDGKKCQVCGADVVWGDHEIHHVDQHAKGGMTMMDNGALVHKACHPKGEAKTAEFAAKWKQKSEGVTAE